MRRVCGSLPCIVETRTIGRLPGSPSRQARIGRPFTEWPMVRTSTTAGRSAGSAVAAWAGPGTDEQGGDEAEDRSEAAGHHTAAVR